MYVLFFTNLRTFAKGYCKNFCWLWFDEKEENHFRLWGENKRSRARIWIVTCGSKEDCKWNGNSKHFDLMIGNSKVNWREPKVDWTLFITCNCNLYINYAVFFFINLSNKSAKIDSNKLDKLSYTKSYRKFQRKFLKEFSSFFLI